MLFSCRNQSNDLPCNSVDRFLNEGNTSIWWVKVNSHTSYQFHDMPARNLVGMKIIFLGNSFDEIWEPLSIHVFNVSMLCQNWIIRSHNDKVNESEANLIWNYQHIMYSCYFTNWLTKPFCINLNILRLHQKVHEWWKRWIEHNLFSGNN